MDAIKLYINETIPGKMVEEGAYYIMRQDGVGTLYRWVKDEESERWSFQRMIPGSPIYPGGLKEAPPMLLYEELGLKRAVEKFYEEKDATPFL